MLHQARPGAGLLVVDRDVDIYIILALQLMLIVHK